MLQTEVRPFVVLPSETNPIHVTQLSAERAIEISADFVQAYEYLLGVKFEFLMRYEMSHVELVRYDSGPENVIIVTYNVIHVCLSQGPVELYNRRAFDHIGYMSLVNESGITRGRWVFIERLRTIDERMYKSHGRSSPYLFGGVAIGMNQTVQIDPLADTPVDIGHTIIDTMTSISHIPQYTTESSTTERFSLAELLGLDGPIENLMQQDPSTKAVSFISCSAPSITSISGISQNWVSLNSSAAPFELFQPECGLGKSSITVPVNTSVYNMLLGLAWQLPIMVARSMQSLYFAVDSSLIHPYRYGFWEMPSDVSHWTELDVARYHHIEEVSLYTIGWGTSLFSWVQSP